MSSAIDKYKAVHFEANVQNSNSYKLIQALLNNVIDKMSKAKYYISENNIAEKGLQISLAITTIEALDASLDLENGGELAANLHDLYLYISSQLLTANFDNNIAILDEVASLVTTIKDGWDGIETEALQILQENQNNAPK